jgi:hypothetical protein
MNKREAKLISDRVIAPDLTDVNLIVLTESPGHVNHARGHVQVERNAQSAVVGPLREGL